MRITNLDPNAVIKWRLTDMCNFSCPYCIRKPLVKKGHEKEDSRKCMDALPEVIRIAGELYANTGKKVKVDLIGGEVTVLPELEQIIDRLLESDVVEKVNITTNMELVDVLKSIASDRITITCSYHPTQSRMTVEEWFEKAAELKPLFKYFKVETVAVKDAPHIERFIELADGYSMDYQVEEDLFNTELTGKACSSAKENYRYEVEDDKGTVRKFYTRNSFLKQYGIEGQAICSEGLLCSRDFDYVYIEQDEVWSCAFKRPIKDYHCIDCWHFCPRESKRCTLCGNISVTEVPRPKFYFED